MTNTVSSRITDDKLSKGIQIESAGKVTAAAPTSSARGLAQFINGTWIGTVRKHKPVWGVDRSDAELLALSTASPCSRYNARCSIEMMARHWEDNAKLMGSDGDGDLYLAHFAGAGTARKVITAGSAPTSAVFSQKAIAANSSILANKTCADVRAWANKKMAAAGGRNWIAVHWSGAKPVVAPPVKKTTAAATATEVVVQTTAQAQGWPVGWMIVGGVAAIAACVAGYFIWRWYDRKNRLVPVEED